MSEQIPVIVLLGVPSHRCSMCGAKMEWGGREQPTEEMLAVCPKCGDGPLIALTADERRAESKL